MRRNAQLWRFAGLPAAIIAAMAAAAPETAPPPDFDDVVLRRFFTDAREHLGPGQPGAASPVPGGSPAGPNSGTPEGTSADAITFAWSKLVSSETLEDEVKRLVQPVAEITKTSTAFKGGGNQQGRILFTEAAALFGVIAQYDGDVRWQRDALQLRDLFAQAGRNCKVGTDGSYKEAQARSEDLQATIRGGTVQLRPANPDATWQETADRQPLMKRLEVAQREHLKAWTSSPGEFASHRADILHEAQLLAMIAQIIKDPSYEYGEDETYLGYVDVMQKHCLELIEAITNDDQQQAQSATGRINQACDTCHGDYRG